MKKKILIFAILMVLLLTACAGEPDANATTAPSTAVPAGNSATPAANGTAAPACDTTLPTDGLDENELPIVPVVPEQTQAPTTQPSASVEEQQPTTPTASAKEQQTTVPTDSTEEPLPTDTPNTETTEPEQLVPLPGMGENELPLVPVG